MAKRTAEETACHMYGIQCPRLFKSNNFWVDPIANLPTSTDIVIVTRLICSMTYIPSYCGYNHPDDAIVSKCIVDIFHVPYIKLINQIIESVS